MASARYGGGGGHFTRDFAIASQRGMSPGPLLSTWLNFNPGIDK